MSQFNKFRFAVSVLGISAYALVSACSSESSAKKEIGIVDSVKAEVSSPLASPGEEPVAPKNIVETARAAGNFTTLLAALEAAGLKETIATTDGITVLAPTDEAFAKIPAETLSAILADKEKLTSILTYHVLSGKALAADVVEKSLSKLILKVDTTNGVKFNSSNVIAADVLASNGVIHAIDTVLLPPTQSIYDIASTNADFSTLKALLDTNGLKDAVAKKGDSFLTVFAPKNSAFADINVAPDLAPSDAVKNILLYHVLPGAFSAAEVVKVTSLPTLLTGKSLLVDLSMGVKVGGKAVIATDIIATNGIVHVVDGVLLPE
jgi:transforming growth factor-beta-induced protein